MEASGTICSPPSTRLGRASSPPRPPGGFGPQLNTIIEDSRESESLADSPNSQADTYNNHNYNTRDKNGVVGMWNSQNGVRASSESSQPRRPPDFDDLYDATDESDCASCPSNADLGGIDSGNGPNDAHGGKSTPRRNSYPIIFIPSTPDRDTFLKNSKNSPVPPTPPPKIPISPAALSRLPRIVPPIYDAPSLAGSNSASSAHPSSASAPPTPDMTPVPDTDWDEHKLKVYSENESANNSVPSSASISPQPDIQLETPEDWNLILNKFPPIPPPDEHDLDAGTSDSESRGSHSVSTSSKGVRLPNAALATLSGLDIDDMWSRQSTSSDVDEIGQMREDVKRPALRRKSTGGLHSLGAGSSSSYTPLSIPSPGGFFASLKGESRRTWCLNTFDPPSSATAEKFYCRPWDAPAQTVVEHVVDMDDDDATEGPPTAKAVISSGPPTARRIPPEGTTAPDDRTLTDNLTQDVNELVEYDELYEDELRTQASANLDRTSIWLAAQSAYLAALAETNPMNEVEGTRANSGNVDSDNTSVAKFQKSVRFLNAVAEEPGDVDNPPTPKISLFYRGFQHVRRRSRDRDTFHQSYFRFEATQAARVSMMEKYLDHLAGKYEFTDHIRPPYRGPFSLAPRNSTLPQTLAEKAMFSKVEKEQDVLVQLYHSMWAIDALKYLHGGRLIPSPARNRLAKATAPLGTPENAGRRRRRVLDFGGRPACGWGWYVSNEYPNVKVYTVVPKDQPINAEIKGPANHRHVSVPQLWNLPFPANQFDLISARYLHMLLKSDHSVGGVDEYDSCLRECFRCLKPGGYLEFFTMDAEITRAGPYGSATSVEFGFNLKTRGYDPAPTRRILSRVKKAGFINLKRAWILLPMGRVPPEEEQDSDPANSTSDNAEQAAEATGSTSSVASTTGLFGGWMWEQWMLKLQMEMGRPTEAFLEETAAVFEEGRRSGAGWRCLSGWATKPKRSSVDVANQAPPPLPPFRPPT